MLSLRQLDPRLLLRAPWILFKLLLFQLPDCFPRQLQYRPDGQPLPLLPIRSDILFRQLEQPGCRVQPFPMHPMIRMLMVFPQMYKPAGQLNQTLVKGSRFRSPSSLQPEGFQHIVRFVVISPVEVVKVGGVADIPPSRIHPFPKHRNTARFSRHAINLAVHGGALKHLQNL